MFDDLEVMLGGGATQVPKPNNTAMKKISKRGSNSQIVPMNDLDDLQDMYQFDSKRAKAPKVPMPQSIPPPYPRNSNIPNVASLPPVARSKHVLNNGLMDDIDQELADDDDFITNKGKQPKTKILPDITTNASPPRNDILSNSSAD